MYRLIQQGEPIKLNNPPKGGNMTNFSILNELSESATFRSFSIKYVFDGCERYQVNGNRYDVKAGEYLLANSFCEGNIEIDSKSLVKGICIDISPVVLSEAFSRFVIPGSPLPNILSDDFFHSEAFLENKYNTDNTRLGRTLAKISRQFNENPFYNYNLGNDFYFTLAENIVEDHQAIIAQLYNINTVKHHTRKELYRRLCRGKTFLENNFDEFINIGNAAEYAMLSEYHFFRLFKAAFGITPQQYLIKMRLSKSLELLYTGNYSVTEVFAATAFSDVFSFSKAFKRQFGFSPSMANESRRNRVAADTEKQA